MGCWCGRQRTGSREGLTPSPRAPADRRSRGQGRSGLHGREPVARKERYLVSLDGGTSKIAAIVGQMTEDEGLDIIGLRPAASKGIRRGGVVNLAAAGASIKTASHEGELPT